MRQLVHQPCGWRQEGSNCGVLNRSQWSGNYFCIRFKFGVNETNLFLIDCYFLSYLMLRRWGSSFISLAAGGRRQEGSNCGVLNRSQWSGNYFCIRFKFGVNETDLFLTDCYFLSHHMLCRWGSSFISLAAGGKREAIAACSIDRNDQVIIFALDSNLVSMKLIYF